jgi:hypothetical protein
MIWYLTLTIKATVPASHNDCLESFLANPGISRSGSKYPAKRADHTVRDIVDCDIYKDTGHVNAGLCLSSMMQQSVPSCE